MKKLLRALALSSLLTLPIISSTPSANPAVRQAQEIGFEDMFAEIEKHLSLNIDPDRVVSSFRLPELPLYEAEITYSSSLPSVLSVEGGIAKVTRPDLGSPDVKVTLSARIAVGKNVKTKDFPLTVLARRETAKPTSPASVYDDFSGYDTGDDLLNYAAWNLKSGSGGAVVKAGVANNGTPGDKPVLQLRPAKATSTSVYERQIKISGEAVMEGYMMLEGEVDEITVEVADGSYRGASVGLSGTSLCYYSGGNRILANPSGFKPADGVWFKFRIELRTSDRSYKIRIYDYDGGFYDYDYGAPGAFSYRGSSTSAVDTLRLTVQAGQKTGSVYLADLKLDSPAKIGETVENPNRSDGIGTVTGFEPVVLHLKSEPDNWTPDLEIRNRFDHSQIYTEGSDYTVKKREEVSGNLKTVTYVITLTATGETRTLVQEVYEDEKENAPSIENFKATNMSGSGTSAALELKGTVIRADSTVYYAVVEGGSPVPTAAEIVGKKAAGLVLSGSFRQTGRTIAHRVEGLDISKTYDVYAVAANGYGQSPVYRSLDITDVINIATPAEFYDMTVNVNTVNSTFRLVDDIDFSGFFWPTSATVLKFAGTLDGEGHTVRNLTIESAYRKAAIFTEIDGATIRNLIVENASISGLQDAAVLAGFSNGGTVESVRLRNCKVGYNGGAGSEGYFALGFGRLQAQKTTMTRLSFEDCLVESSKYSGALAGNINKSNAAELVATDIYCDAKFRSEGAGQGLIGRNRGRATLQNVVAYLEILDAKKEVGLVAGHNKEGGQLTVRNLVGRLQVDLITQSTYFNNFIGSHDPNTSGYSYSDVAFFTVDHSNLSDSAIIPTTQSRDAGRDLAEPSAFSQEWWEENTFFLAFSGLDCWYYDAESGRPMLDFAKKKTVTAAEINGIINNLPSELGPTLQHGLRQALFLYDQLGETERAKVDLTALLEKKSAYEKAMADLEDIWKQEVIG